MSLVVTSSGLLKAVDVISSRLESLNSHEVYVIQNNIYFMAIQGFLKYLKSVPWAQDYRGPSTNRR